MKISVAVLLFIFFFSPGSEFYAQPQITLAPASLSYTDVFNRLDSVRITNTGNQPLIIDSIGYNDSLYAVDYNITANFPLTLQPGESFVMDCFFWNIYRYYRVNQDVIFYNNSQTPQKSLPISVNLTLPAPQYGYLIGAVTDGINPVSDAKVYFFRDGYILLDSTTTDTDGYFSMYIPYGKYLVGAKTGSSYLSFYPSTTSPFRSVLYNLITPQSAQLILQIIPRVSTGNTIAGKLKTAVNNNLINKGIVVTRKGKHTPTSPDMPVSGAAAPEEIAALTLSDGSYSAEDVSGSSFLLLQSYASFKAPGYFNTSFTYAPNWNNADSILPSGYTGGKDIVLLKNTAYGNGEIEGRVLVQGMTPGDPRLKGFTVTAYKLPDFLPVASSLLDDDDEYEIEHLPLGTYQVTLERPGDLILYGNQITLSDSSSKFENINFIVPLSNLEDSPQPSDYLIFRNHPNPFNPITNLTFNILTLSDVNLTVYDIQGEMISTLINKELTAGTYTLTWDGKNSAGDPMQSGVYFARLNIIDIFGVNVSKTIKLMLLK